MDSLQKIIRRLSTPLDPQPTGVEPRLPKLDGIRAVVFDVYGTLLISGSGDISLTSGVSKGSAAQEALGPFGFLAPDGDAVVAALKEIIQRHHAESPAEYPEVDILRVWEECFLFCRESKFIRDQPVCERTLFYPELAVEYECRVNPVWPMPEMVSTLTAIGDAGLPMGIVSNAQFFTPYALEEFAGQTLRSLGFVPSVCVWSYAHLQAKPGRFLYEQAAEALAEQGIQPAEVLYVGNDMLNDVWPAAEVGFRTALFAGDARSLRLREGDPRVEGVEPDAVVTELRQLLTILSLAAG